MPKSRRNARGRPQRWQRLYFRTLNLGSRFHFSTIDFLATTLPPGAKRHSSYACAPLTLTEGHVQQPQQLLPLFVGPRGRDERDVHPPDLLHLVVIDLRKNDLLRHAQRVIPAAVEGAGRDPAEVADSRQRHVHQPVVELVHPRAAQRHHAADGLSLAQLEVRDRLLGLAYRGALAGDLAQLGRRGVEHLDVRERVAHAHVHDDLPEARRLHRVRVLEALHQLGKHLLLVLLAHPGDARRALGFADGRDRARILALLFLLLTRADGGGALLALPLGLPGAVALGLGVLLLVLVLLFVVGHYWVLTMDSPHRPQKRSRFPSEPGLTVTRTPTWHFGQRCITFET